MHPSLNKYSWTREWNYLANTSLKITQGPSWLQWQLYLSVFGMWTTQCSGGSWAQRLCVDTFFIVMQESHSRAYINSYVKWPFIRDNLFGREDTAWLLCGNDTVMSLNTVTVLFSFLVLLWVKCPCSYTSTLVSFYFHHSLYISVEGSLVSPAQQTHAEQHVS